MYSDKPINKMNWQTTLVPKTNRLGFEFLGKAVFGLPLEVATKQTRLPDGVELPRVFRESIVHIEENCKLKTIMCFQR